MKYDNVSCLQDSALFRKEPLRRFEYMIPDGSGKIVSYHLFNSLQIIFYDIHSSDIPDLWRLGFRKGDEGRYMRTLICRRGACECTIKGGKLTLTAGYAVIDYSIGDDRSFFFDTKRFTGIEITMQIDTLVRESDIFNMFRLVIKSMFLPEETVFGCNGYLFGCSKTTMQTLDKLLTDGFDGAEGIIILDRIVRIQHNIAFDIKERAQADRRNISAKQRRIAEDMYHCLTNNISTRNTALQFAKKYGVSDTTIYKYFRNVYGFGFKEYQIKVRMGWASEKLITTDMKVGEIACAVGYSNSTKFCQAFKQYYGVTPLAYRRTNKNIW